VAEQIEAAASLFRQMDREELSAEHTRLAGAVQEVKAITQRARTASEQVRREKIVAGVCFLSGLMLWPIFEQIVRA
jgi:hypothetical protein